MSMTSAEGPNLLFGVIKSKKKKKKIIKISEQLKNWLNNVKNIKIRKAKPIISQKKFKWQNVEIKKVITKTKLKRVR